MNFIPKNNFIEEFTKSYEKELFNASGEYKLFCYKEAQKEKQDLQNNHEKIKFLADNILESICNRNILKCIVLEDYKGDLFFEFESVCENDSFFSMFIVYDIEDNKICKIKTQSILWLAIKGIIEKSINYEIVEFFNGEIRAFKNKYNDSQMISRLNKTKKYFDDLVIEIGFNSVVYSEANIRPINNYNINKFKMLDSFYNYYDSCLFSLFYQVDNKIPLLFPEEKLEEYKKRFFKNYQINNNDIDLYFDRFKEIYRMLEDNIECKILPRMFYGYGFLDIINTTPYLELFFDDNYFKNHEFYIIVKDGLNVVNILDEYIYINSNKSTIFIVKDLIENKDEVLKYLKTLEY